VHLLTLAAEATPKGLWYPTILGVLVVVAGVGLFCGSIYLLLGTNLGARLGFLIAFTALAGFMMLLSTLWMTTASPLNTLKGRIPQWKVLERVDEVTRSKFPQARSILGKGHTAPATEASNIKASVDAALVTQVPIPTAPLPADANKFSQFADVTKYMVVKTYEVGGSKPQFWKLQLTHVAKFAVVQYCGVTLAPSDRPFGLAPPAPVCATSGDNAKSGFLVIEYDLGSLRVPPFVVFSSSLILFGLGLLLLHWREKDEMAAAKAPAPSPARVPVGV
jgi:hypothetical protein